MYNEHGGITQKKIDQAFFYLINNYEIKCFYRFNNSLIWCLFASIGRGVERIWCTSEYKLPNALVEKHMYLSVSFHLTWNRNKAALIIGRKEGRRRLNYHGMKI
jgi:hypothetical protein